MNRVAAPKRGDILRINLDPPTGHEQAGFRPAIVISNTLYNGHASTVVVCPVTSRQRGWPFEVALPAALSVKGFVLVDQVRVVDWRARASRLIASCPQDLLDAIDAKLDLLFRGVVRHLP